MVGMRKIPYTCYHCAQIIKGEVKHTKPHPDLKGDFPRAYHPSCYVASEKEAAKELGVPYEG